MQPSPDGALVYERLSDPILVRRAKHGDPAALRALCERHAPRVERNTCKDVAQARWTAEHRTEPLGGCFADLPAAQATVVALKDAFEVPFEEISEATGLSVGTAKCYAHRGRNRLRARVSA